jgi:2'-5' RNA ligase
MTVADPTSGVVVRVRLPAPLERIRRRSDLAAAAGAPAHVTILFPFLAEVDLLPAVRRDLVRIAATLEPFEVRFTGIGRFPRAAYLTPQPSAPFARLTAAIVARYPDHPPYEGAFDEVVPHLTLVESATAPLDEIAAAAARHLPFTRRVDAIEVLVEGSDQHWRSHWRIRLGVRR